MEFINKINSLVDWPKAQEDLRRSYSLLSGKTTDASSKTAIVFSDIGIKVKKSLAGLQANTKNWFNRGFWKHKKYWKSGAAAGAAIIGLQTISSFAKKTVGDITPVIPKEYDQGYDNIKERISDFGSPVKLANTAQKIITPNFSVVRRAKHTTTNAIIKKNTALYNSDRAISHTRY